MAKRRAKADVLQFPPGGRAAQSIDVRKLLLDTQSAPTLPQPADVTAAIERRARELAEEAYIICREHLRRRVASNCEVGWPRVLNVDRAHRVIAEGSLGDALVRDYRRELEFLQMTARVLARSAEECRAKFAATLAEAEDGGGE